MIRFAIPTAALLVLTAQAADQAFVRPLIGHVFDSRSRQIRAMVGTPGAARVAEAVPLEISIDRVLTGARGPYAIVSAVEGEALFAARLLDGQVAATPIPNSMRSFDLGAFSPGGSTAILYGSQCDCIQVIVGFPASPEVKRTIERSQFVGSVTAIAVDGEGNRAAISTSTGDEQTPAGEITLFDVNGDGQRRVASSSAISMAFSPSGADLAIADAQQRTILLVRDVANSAELVGLMAESDGLGFPSAVNFLEDSRLAAADRSGFVHFIDLESGARSSTSCFCKPELLEATALPAVRRVTGAGEGSVWILDLTGTEPRILFVPVEPQEGSAAQ
jgi:hypothetical protein